MKIYFKIITLSVALMLFVAGCDKEELNELPQQLTTSGISIFVNEGKVYSSILVNHDNVRISNAYYEDSTRITYYEILSMLPNGEFFKTSIDENYLASTVYRKKSGQTTVFKFPRYYTLDPYRQLFYYRNDNLEKLDTTAFGVVYAVDASENDEIIAGFFGKRGYSQNGEVLIPSVPFYHNLKTKKTVQLPMPSNFWYFNGISTITKYNNDVYVAGLVDFPMYWKNNEFIRLDDNYGEVTQIKIKGNDVYAVGFYNKENSSYGRKIAVYWKNGVRIELGDNAASSVANGIFIDGEDVYVVGTIAGSTSNIQSACYWKNGKLTILKY